MTTRHPLRAVLLDAIALVALCVAAPVLTALIALLWRL